MHPLIALVALSSLALAAPSKPWYAPSLSNRTAWTTLTAFHTVVPDSISNRAGLVAGLVRRVSSQTPRERRFPPFLISAEADAPLKTAGVCSPCFSSTYKTCSSGRSTAATSWFVFSLPPSLLPVSVRPLTRSPDEQHLRLPPAFRSVPKALSPSLGRFDGLLR
jgi:hypothetical protein